MKKRKEIKENYDIVIVGTGIAGSLLAYELEKKKMDYLIITDKLEPLRNISTLSFGHCRLVSPENLDSIVRINVSKLGEDEEKMRFVYSQTDLVPKLFKELGIPFEYRSFGIIPKTEDKRGGAEMMGRIQEKIPEISTSTELVDFKKNGGQFDVKLAISPTFVNTKARYLVLAAGGYNGKFFDSEKRDNLFGMVERNGGRIINRECVFVHPFGYNNGEGVLIGDQAKKGRFVDEKGNLVFDEETRKMIENDSYHENFDRIIEQIYERQNAGSKVYFYNGSKILITPYVHYRSGGIKTVKTGEAEGCPGLFAIGECQANGSKRPGRLPGYPFTSSVVYSRVLAEYFGNNLK